MRVHHHHHQGLGSSKRFGLCVGRTASNLLSARPSASCLAATTSAEPAWHRRARARRAEARVLLRLGAAAELLQGHHSAQRAARQPPPSSMPREQQQRLSRSQRRKLQAERAGDPGEQRRPHWGCSECGEPRNWACRSSCRGCGASGPQHLEAGRRAEACGGGPGGGRTAGPGGAGRPSTSRAQWRLRPGEVSASSPKAAPMAAQGFRPGERTARTPKARSTPP